MSKLYPDPNEKVKKTKVRCISCQALEFQDKDKNSYCPTFQRNMQEDEVIKKEYVGSMNHNGCN